MLYRAKTLSGTVSLRKQKGDEHQGVNRRANSTAQQRTSTIEIP